jgi:hypothetical protein
MMKQGRGYEGKRRGKRSVKEEKKKGKEVK